MFNIQVIFNLLFELQRIVCLLAIMEKVRLLLLTNLHVLSTSNVAQSRFPSALRNVDGTLALATVDY